MVLGDVVGSQHWQFMATSENISYIQYNDNLKSSRGAWFQVNYVDEGPRVVDIASSETSKTFRDRRTKDMGLIKTHTSLDLKKAWSHIYGRVTNSILMILLG